MNVSKLKRKWRAIRDSGRICAEWAGDFDAFRSYVQALPGYDQPGLSLRHVNRAVPVGPGNLCWRADGEQTSQRLYNIWRMAKAHRSICLEWSGSYEVFRQALEALPGYAPGAKIRLLKLRKEELLGPGNVRWGTEEDKLEQSEHPLYARWITMKMKRQLCSEWRAHFHVFRAAVESLPDYSGTGYLRRHDKKQLFGPGNAYWYVTAPPGAHEHPHYRRWSFMVLRGDILCPEWTASFEAFRQVVDALPGYTPWARLRRISRMQLFCPGNVRWESAEMSTKHPMYARWHSARKGGVLCQRWAENFDLFTEEVMTVPGYVPGARLNRIRKGKKFDLNNVRWSPPRTAPPKRAKKGTPK